MNDWKNYKWLVILTYFISAFLILLFVIVRDFATFILTAFFIGLTIYGRKKYKEAVEEPPIATGQINNSINTNKDNNIILNTNGKTDINSSFNNSTEGITPQPIISDVPTPRKNFEIFEFNVAGVTAKNDSNKDIQKLLQRNGKLYCKEHDIELYSGYTNKEILEFNSEVFEFENLSFSDDEISFIPEPDNPYDKNAVKIFIDYSEAGKHHVGYVPKKLTLQLIELLNNHKIQSIQAEYVGGKMKEVEYDYEKDKDVVVINDELTLGVHIEIYYS